MERVLGSILTVTGARLFLNYKSFWRCASFALNSSGLVFSFLDCKFFWGQQPSLPHLYMLYSLSHNLKGVLHKVRDWYLLSEYHTKFQELLESKYGREVEGELLAWHLTWWVTIVSSNLWAVDAFPLLPFFFLMGKSMQEALPKSWRCLFLSDSSGCGKICYWFQVVSQAVWWELWSLGAGDRSCHMFAPSVELQFICL